MSYSKGLFVTLEGGEGSGKTTLALKMKETLEKEGFEVVLTREPGGVKVAEDIRSVIMSGDMDATTQAFLFAAARREHLVEKVLPALERGAIVICDRFVHSSLVYQGVVGGLGVKKVFAINEQAIDGKMPDLTLYMDIKPEDGLSRIQGDAGREVNHFDQKPLSYHEKIREGYQLIPTFYPEHPYVTIDASQAPDAVYQDAMKVIGDLIKKELASPKHLTI